MSMIASVDFIDEGNDWKISIPTQGLASNSLLITPKGEENPSELYQTMQKVAQYWESHGISNYLVYKSSADQSWEMVPTEGQKSSLWDRIRSYARQFLIVARVTFGRYFLSGAEIEHLIASYESLTSFKAQETAQKTQHIAQDAFCKKEVIDSQCIFDGKEIRVLYNYAPIGSEGLHFLIVPKAHKERFTELSLQEFEEMQTVAASLIKHYPNHLCYRYSKTGSLAGQTVPHFHEHVVFLQPQDDLWGKLSVFFRMILPPRPIDSKELAARVSQYQNI